MKEETITGYQYSSVTYEYTGEYVFPKNKNSDVIHLPPNTTLVKPPFDLIGLNVGEMFKYNKSKDEWYRDINLDYVEPAQSIYEEMTVQQLLKEE